MIEKFKSFVRENDLFTVSDSILLTVSGGMDSMALAALCSLAGFDFAIAHCNFKLRGKEADADEAFVKQTADHYQVPFYSRSFDTGTYAREQNISVQMAARDLRYAWFDELARIHGYDRIATAHHLDDQTETFFLNLLRGCGIAGLHGIRLRQGKIVRPLMFATRKEIESFVKKKNIPFRVDHTNAETKYMRNKIRHQVIPALMEINPDFQKEMAGNISRLADVEEIFRREIDRIKEEIIVEKDGLIQLDIAKLKSARPVRTILFELIRDYGFKENDLDNIISALDASPGKTFISSGHQLLIDRKKILITPKNEGNTNKAHYYIDESERVFSGPFRLELSILPADGYDIPTDKDTASLDHTKLVFPLRLRRWEQGDQFMPLGMKHRKKLSDLFTDEKYSRIEKENAWVLCSGSDIVWIVGERIDERYKISTETNKVYRISILQ
ncbi:MAG: tRNA lysidine(34) synthetase TilS [Bacteroidales bacterium]|nr:tRNA lysidine(34) synthetase TilS [Bacteroidales bacterium]